MRVKSMNTRKAAYYAVLAAYIVFMVAMLLRSQRTDRQLSNIENRVEHINRIAASGGLDP